MMNKETRTLLIQISLFVVTLIFTTLAGAEWMYGGSFIYGRNPMGWQEFYGGLNFSIPFLFILTCHEFGHYFTARYHKVKVSLPYYLPMWLGFLPSISIGTMGAFIRLKEQVKSLTKTFDIGLAGPLAGFAVAILVIIYGFSNLPPKEHIYSIHPEYELFGANFEDHVYEKDTFFLKTDLAKISPEVASNYDADTIRIGPSYQLGIQLGSNLIFDFAKAYIVPENEVDRIPNPNEMFHNPYLFAGFLALLFTALNLIPIGQLDGGHVLYGLIGEKKFKVFATLAFITLIFYSGLGNGVFGFFNPFDLNQDMIDIMIAVLAYAFFIFYLLGKTSFNNQQKLMISLGIISLQAVLLLTFPGIKGYGGWMIYAFFIGRFLGIYHPPSEIEEPLSMNRKTLGWIALIIFILSFSPQPFIISG
jgi:membrane-associated protease RseP (regulator of RpoE activity)